MGWDEGPHWVETRHTDLPGQRRSSLSKAVIDGPEPPTPDTNAYFPVLTDLSVDRRISSSMRGYSFLGAEDHRMDVTAWLRGLALD